MGVHPLDFMEKKVMNPSIPGAGSSKDMSGAVGDRLDCCGGILLYSATPLTALIVTKLEPAIHCNARSWKDKKKEKKKDKKKDKKKKDKKKKKKKKKILGLVELRSDVAMDERIGNTTESSLLVTLLTVMGRL